MKVADEIYQMILDDLHITYDTDQSTERRIKNEILAGIEYIQTYCDPAADCMPGTSSARLLCDYVLRAESGDVETFKSDFAEEITGMKIGYDAKTYAEAMGYIDQKEE